MVEPLFFSEIGLEVKVASKFSLSGPEAKHAVSVRRLGIGERVRIADGLGTMIRGQVVSTGRDVLEIEVEELLQLEQPKTKISLVQALAKGDRDELAIQAATELGISNVIPWQAERSISIWNGAKKSKGVARWQTIVQEAAKQSLRGFVPIVEAVVSSSELIGRLKEYDLVLVLEPTSLDSIVSIQPDNAKTIALVVGPEGGISEAELNAFRNAGFSLVHLGEGVLRTSTAGMAAISFLQAKLGAWN